MKKISIIIPIFNVNDTYLEKCFESLHSQSMHDIEIIIIDDGSGQKCASKCDEFASVDSRVIVVHQENKGAASARNKGLSIATGEYIMFLDADDWLLDGTTCENIYRNISSTYDIVFFSYKMNQITRMTEYSGVLEKDYSCEDLQSTIIRKRQIGANIQVASPWAKVFKRDFLDSYNIFFNPELRRTHDRLFMLECLHHNPTFVFRNNPIMCFNTLNEDSLSRRFDTRTALYLQTYYYACHNYVENYYPKNVRFINDLKYLYLKLYFEICDHTYFHPKNNDQKKKKMEQFCDFTEEYFQEFDNTYEDKELSKREMEIIELIRNKETKRAFNRFIMYARIDSCKRRIKYLIRKR